MSEINNGGLDQYGAEPIGQQQFRTAGAERVNVLDQCFTIFYQLRTPYQTRGYWGQ